MAAFANGDGDEYDTYQAEDLDVIVAAAKESGGKRGLSSAENVSGKAAKAAKTSETLDKEFKQMILVTMRQVHHLSFMMRLMMPVVFICSALPTGGSVVQAMAKAAKAVITANKGQKIDPRKPAIHCQIWYRAVQAAKALADGNPQMAAQAKILEDHLAIIVRPSLVNDTVTQCRFKQQYQEEGKPDMCNLLIGVTAEGKPVVRAFLQVVVTCQEAIVYNGTPPPNANERQIGNFLDKRGRKQ